jgi:Sulfotransferase family
MEKIDVDKLLKTARERTGLSDFGPPEFMQGLNILANGINTEVNIRADRWDHLRERFLRLLTNRLWFAKDLKDHPEINDEDLGSPIIITSLPRTASTKLHRMLGATGDFQTVPMWQGHLFARIPGLPDGGREQRIKETRTYEKWVYQVSPSMLTGHPMFTDEPEEDLLLGEFTFAHTFIFGMFASMSYAQWVLQADMTKTYDYLLAQIKYLQWQSPSERGKPWLNKTPCHFGNEAHLCRIFKSPRFIVTHRDPAKCIPSITSTTIGWREMYSVGENDANVGAGVTEMFAQGARQHMKWRDSSPQSQILDLSFNEINVDSLGTVRKVYDFFGMTLSPKAEAAVLNWEKNNPRDKHGLNKYSAAAIGTTEENIRKAFTPYIERYSTYTGG